MFNFSISSKPICSGSVGPPTYTYSPHFSLRIEWCPESGIDAVDFRREHGLPAGTDHYVALPSRFFDSSTHPETEGICRDYPELLTRDADLRLCDVSLPEWHLLRSKPTPLVRRLYTAKSESGDRRCYTIPMARPAAIAAWIKDQTTATGRALLDDILDREHRSLQTATVELAEYEEQLAREKLEAEEEAAAGFTREEARTLLASEISELRRQIESQ